MFDEYTDPYDIDNYYDDVGKIFERVSDYVDTKQIQPVQQELSTQATIATSVPTTEAPSTQAVSKFEVVPNTIFIDGHPVGSQPRYNILQSGPPEKESFHTNRYRCGDMFDHHGMSTTMTIIISLIFFIMFVYIIHLQMQVRGNNMLMCMLVNEILSKKK